MDVVLHQGQESRLTVNYVSLQKIYLMKRLVLSILAIFPIVAMAQIPTGYYNTAAGLSGQPLRVALRNIVRPHTVLTYTPGLWNAFYTTDVKPSGKLWDMYSDIPGGTPAYEYVLGPTTSGGNQCGSVSPSAEGSCYNREHTWPQSKFASDTPMQHDLFLVIPSDYFVNGQRGNLPYGKVGTASQTFTNGSKIGNNVYPGAPSGSCYEPLDSFKGDLARNYLYIATCYWTAQDSVKFTTWEMATGLTFKPWAIQMLLEWHHNDPVSQKEINRNNAVYPLQANRNPFIDHPEYADCIWGTTCIGVGVTDVKSFAQSVVAYVNAANNTLMVNWDNLAGDDVTNLSVLNMNGQLVYGTSAFAANKAAAISTATWAKGIYVLRIQSLTGVESRKIVIQ